MKDNRDKKISQSLILVEKSYQNVSNAASLNGIKVKAQVNTILTTSIRSPNPKMPFLNVIYFNVIPGTRVKYNSVKRRR